MPLAGLWRPVLAHTLALLGATASFAAAAAGLLQVLAEGEQLYQLGGWPAPIGIIYLLDPLSALMSVLVTSLGLLSVVYARHSVAAELRERTVPFYSLLLLLLGGLLGIVLTHDLFNLFVFLEVSSLATYILIAAGGGRALLAGYRYLLLGTLGGSLYLLGVGYLYFLTGSLHMGDVGERLLAQQGSPAALAAVALIVVGLSLKMALFPLHVWLPPAYSYAPSAAITMISAVMTKVMAYALIRVLLDVFRPEYARDALAVTNWIAWLAAAGIVAGSLLAISQKELRRVLAYSSVSQLAYIGLGIGLANPLALTGALLHILNHAMLKGCLFMVAGSISYRRGRKEIFDLRGVGRAMPWSGVALTLAGLSLIGIPPTAGFFSKWYLALGSIEAENWIFLAVILGGSLLSAVYVFRIFEQAYLGGYALEEHEHTEGQEPPNHGQARVKAQGHEHRLTIPLSRQLTDREAPPSMVVPALLLGIGVLILGVGNAAVVTQVIERVAVRGL